MKKGFTLIELVGVVVVLAVIGFVVYPIINGLLVDNKEQIYERQIEQLEKIASNWVVANSGQITFNDNETHYLYLDDLYEQGYIEENELYNPKTNEPLTGCITITWQDKINQHIYNYDPECNVVTPPGLVLRTDDGVINNNGWAKEDFIVYIEGQGLDNYTYCVSDNECTPDTLVNAGSGNVSINTEGTKHICAYGKNNLGTTNTVCKEYKLDKTKPVIGTINVVGTLGLNDYYVSNVEVSYTNSTDALSGIDSETFTPGAGIVDYDTEGITYTLTATDKAGNSDTVSHTIKVDVTKPENGVVVFNGTLGSNDWYTSDVTLTINSTDEYVMSSNTSSITENTDGTTVTVTTTDKAGNTNPKDYVIKVDMDKPTLTAKGGPFEIYVGDNVDSKTYFNEPTYSISGKTSYECSPVNTSTLTEGTQTITCTATGGNGLYEIASVEIEVINPVYLVTLDNQSATNAGTTSINATYGSAMPSITVPTRTGYTFGGYYTEINGSGTQYYTASGASARNWDQYAEDTLYAKWTVNTYTITLNQQSGSGGSNSATATYGSAMPSITVPTRTGYTFGGYYTGTNGSGTQYYTAAGASARNWNLASNTTLYAKWTIKTYKVTLSVTNGTGGSSKNINHGSNGTWTVTANNGYTTTGATFSPSGCGTISGSTVTISNVTSAKTCTVTLPIKDTTPPTIASIKAKGYIGGNTITGTLKDNSNLAGYYITSNSSYACGGTVPTSWNSISGTSKSLNAKVTNYGTTYIWVKDAAGNTNCTSKTLYLVNPIVSGTNTCQLLSDSYVKEDSNTIKMQINVKCSCGITGTCRNGRNGGTDSDRGYAGVEVKGATSVYYKIWGYSYSTDSLYTGPSWGGKIYQYQTLSTTLPNSELTINSSNNQLLTTNGEGDGVSGYSDWSSSNYMTLSKITANGVSIYNNGFVEY